VRIVDAGVIVELLARNLDLTYWVKRSSPHPT